MFCGFQTFICRKIRLKGVVAVGKIIQKMVLSYAKDDNTMLFR